MFVLKLTKFKQSHVKRTETKFRVGHRSVVIQNRTIGTAMLILRRKKQYIKIDKRFQLCYSVGHRQTCKTCKNYLKDKSRRGAGNEVPCFMSQMSL